MYKGKNLLSVPASNNVRFITSCMEILFTKDEMANGLVIESESTKSDRKRLDLERYKLLESKFIINAL